MSVALVTNVREYAGLPAVEALAADGFTVVCHDRSFADPAAREAFASVHPGLEATAEQAPEALIAGINAAHGGVDVVVSNDAFPAVRAKIEDADLAAYREMIEALLVFPFALAKAAVPQMKARKRGKLILVTSGAPLRPYPRYSMYASARGGATALAIALAKELGPFNIQVNAIAPNFLASETYYPRAVWEEDPKFRAVLHERVPLGRLGRPEEIGALVAFLASGRCDFVTGQVIPFTGGWP